MSSTDVPVGTSTTPGVRTAPPTETRVVPGAAGAPTDANHGSAEAGDEGQVREGLRVLHQGRPAGSSTLERPVGVDRRADAVADPVRQGALLARHVAGRRRHQPDGDRIDAGSGPFVEGRVEHRDERRATVDGDERVGRADGARGERDAVEHQVGRAGDEDCVLAARGLALHRVRDDDGVAGAAQAAAPRGALDDGANLPLGGEPAATASTQARGGQLVDEVAGGRPTTSTDEWQGAHRARVVREGGGGVEAKSSGHVPIVGDERQGGLTAGQSPGKGL